LRPLSDNGIPSVTWWATLALLSAALFAPLLIADVPPILDYPNHLARFTLLAAGPDDPVLGPLFRPHWAIIPNLASDVVGPMLLRILPIHVAGRSMLAGILLLNLVGVLALHRALFGRVFCWPLASGLVAYNSNFMLGFLNGQIGIGLAMIFAAAWITWREEKPAATVVAAMMASVVLFFCHLIGVVFFLALICSSEIYAVRHHRAMGRALWALLPVLAAPVLLSFLTTLRDAPAALHWMTPQEKLIQLASPFINYSFPLDMITAALLYGGVVLGVALGWLAVAPRAVAAVAALAVLYPFLPFDLMSASFVDTRVAVMLGFLLFAATERAALPRRIRSIFAAGLIGLFAARMTIVADVWLEHRRDLADLRSVMASVPAGALVYVTNVSQEEAPAYWDAAPRSRRLSNTLRADFHLPALLLIERKAFWPILFANPAQQPISLRAPYDRLARAAHDIPSHATLVADPDRGSAALDLFDFVLMLEAGADHNPDGFVPKCVALLSRTDFAALYRVRHEKGACVADQSNHNSRGRALYSIVG
jgi:hypothetical protein